MRSTTLAPRARALAGALFALQIAVACGGKSAADEHAEIGGVGGAGTGSVGVGGTGIVASPEGGRAGSLDGDAGIAVGGAGAFAGDAGTANGGAGAISGAPGAGAGAAAGAGSDAGNGGNLGGLGNAGGSGGSGGAASGGVSGSAGAGGAPASCNPIVFADPKLEAVVRQEIGKPSGDITPTDVRLMTDVEANGQGIASLSGIECLPLSYLYLGEGTTPNQISDLTPLAALKALKYIDLSANPVSDLAPLAELNDLQRLELSGLTRTLDAQAFKSLAKLPALNTLNLIGDTVEDLTPLAQSSSLRSVNLFAATLHQPASLSSLKQLTSLELSGAISDLAPLAGLTRLNYLGLELVGVSDITVLQGLTNLHVLDISENNVADISAVAGMTELTDLYLSENRVADLSPVRALTKLTYLEFSDNAVTTISALVDNPGLGQGATASGWGNPLDCAAEAANIAALRSRQVSVFSDCQ